MTSDKGSRFRRFLRKSGLGFCGLLVLGGIYLGALHFTGNFNTVVDGEFYRSGQLTANQITTYAKAYGIKTIINLRGDNTGNAWYDAEIAESRNLNLTHLDFRMSARRDMTAAQATELIGLMKNAQKPVLIHCQAGADRSGLASALYLAAIKETDQATAKGQLSIRYGHLSLPLIAEYAMDRSFEALQPALVLRSR